MAAIENSLSPDDCPTPENAPPCLYEMLLEMRRRCDGLALALECTFETYNVLENRQKDGLVQLAQDIAARLNELYEETREGGRFYHL